MGGSALTNGLVEKRSVAERVMNHKEFGLADRIGAEGDLPRRVFHLESAPTRGTTAVVRRAGVRTRQAFRRSLLPVARSRSHSCLWRGVETFRGPIAILVLHLHFQLGVSSSVTVGVAS